MGPVLWPAVVAAGLVVSAPAVAGDVGKAIEKGVHDTGKAIEKGAHDSGKAIEKGAHDTGKANEKAGRDIQIEKPPGPIDPGNLQ